MFYLVLNTVSGLFLKTTAVEPDMSKWTSNPDEALQVPEENCISWYLYEDERFISKDEASVRGVLDV